MSFLNLRLAMRASVINQLKNVRYISYDALRHAEELEEIGLRINDRQYFLSLRSHKSVNFVKVSEISRYRRSIVFLELEKEVPEFIYNLNSINQSTPRQEQDVKCNDDIKQIVFSLLPGTPELIGTILKRSDGGKDKNGIRIEAAAIEKLTTALESLTERASQFTNK